MVSKWFSVVVCCFYSLSFSAGFNLAPQYAQIFSDPQNQKGSYFGFAVALQQVDTASTISNRLIVGAPRGNSSYRAHRDIYQPGVVYRCDLKEEGNNRCIHLLLDPEGNTRHPAANGNSYEHMKDNAWIGGTVKTAETKNGPLVVCGHRWKNSFHDNYYLMNGICYSSDSSATENSTANLLIPLLNSGKQAFRAPGVVPQDKRSEVFNYAYGQAGISAHLTKDGRELLLGAPGVIDWTGTVLRYISYGMSYDGSHVAHINVPNPYYTRNMEPDELFGYAVSSGTFFVNSSHMFVAGAPRAAQYRGKVLVFDYPSRDDHSLKVKIELQGSQMGEYFGSSLCVVDLNNDGLDDIVVGAPLHSLPSHEFETGAGDEGRIYVFLNKGEGTLTEVTSSGSEIMGSVKHAARFGTSIANLGDLNYDGYQDIVVGAPYEDNGRGAIYIYHGQKNGIKSKYKQRIAASDINSAIFGFGQSISNSLDIDDNHYNDIAVGAYDSGHVVVIKSNPVITFNAELTSDVRRISFNATQFRIAACVGYTGQQAPQHTDAMITVKIDPVYGRAHITYDNESLSTYSYPVQMILNDMTCRKFDIEIKKGQQDFSKPIEVTLEYKLIQPNRKKRQASSPDFCKICPVLDPELPNYVTLRVPYATGCGEEDICRTDLFVRGEFKNITKPFIIGSSKSVAISVIALNRLEPAFLSRVQVVLPSDTSLNRVPSMCRYLDELSKAASSRTVECDIGNPLKADSNKTLDLSVDVSKVDVSTENLTFNISVLSAGEEQYPANNIQILHLQLRSLSDVVLIGKSSQEQVVYSKQNDSKLEDVTLTHSYEVQNKGPSPIDKMKLEFLVPVSIDSAAVVNLYAPEGLLDDQPVHCETYNYSFIMSSDDEKQFVDSSQVDAGLIDFNKRQKRSVEEELTRVGLSLSRTLVLNCSSPGVKCISIVCPSVGPFDNLQTQAIFHLKVKVALSILNSMLDKRDAILLSTLGKATFQPSANSLKPGNDGVSQVTVSTTFFGKVQTKGVATWIIVVAVLGGLFILLLLGFALYKLGFFKRGTKEELEALKKDDDEDGCSNIMVNDETHSTDQTDSIPDQENGIHKSS